MSTGNYFEIKTTLEELDSLFKFPQYSRAYYAVKYWKAAVLLCNNWSRIDDWDMTLPVMLYKYAISRFLLFVTWCCKDTTEVECKLVDLAEYAGLELTREQRIVLAKVSDYRYDGTFADEDCHARWEAIERLDCIDVNILDEITRACFNLCTSTMTRRKASDG